MNKKRLFIDMDGTLAEYRPFVSEEQFYQPGYFSSLSPYTNLVSAVNTLINDYSDFVEVYILSSCMPLSNAPAEKTEWLKMFLPSIDKKHRLFPAYGTNKGEYLKSEGDFLIDDYSKNLNEWTEFGGIGIKFRNGLNGTKGSWEGACLNHEDSSEILVKKILFLLNL